MKLWYDAASVEGNEDWQWNGVGLMILEIFNYRVNPGQTVAQPVQPLQLAVLSGFAPVQLLKQVTTSSDLLNSLEILRLINYNLPKMGKNEILPRTSIISKYYNVKSIHNNYDYFCKNISSNMPQYKPIYHVNWFFFFKNEFVHREVRSSDINIGFL